ncbi:thiolase family protein [Actinophytocola gossypii]|uniref:Acetyl-CoA C-acyltransferase n=1 Tax=Actinophytocola gossypii TaxID=2812003 RepID=A0ABT2J3Q9_9PSEU|nr:acetyl-CoA C-acyltransferase [Actinophytocola gossypii]MCT2582244.1 acetyl-CoA C-acyltransferase [Actinophytocola gossypii]
MREAVVVDAVRTPIGRKKGALAGVHAVDLSAVVLNDLLRRVGAEPGIVDDVYWGCVTQLGDQSSNVGRFATLAAGWPESIPAVTINRACGSSQQALEFAAHAVMCGRAEVVVAGGVETMNRVPIGSGRTMGEPYGRTTLDRYGVDTFSQGIGAELIAEKWDLSRTRLDEFAAVSHERAAAAIDSGAFTGQLAPVALGDARLEVDEALRRGTSVATLAGLTSSFREGGRIHAGNSSQIADGAAALLVTTPERAARLGRTPLARFHSGAVVGDDPVTMLTGPIPATERVLASAGLGIHDIGAFEINEAFAPVPLAWQLETGADPARLNPVGGAIAVGHPLGASGAILATRLIHHMRQNDIRYGLQSMCEGGGTANATIFELVARA